MRAFVPAREHVEDLSALADLEKVSLLSYNVLSQMGARRLQRGKMGYVDPALLTISTRREKLLQEILSYDADILCLQEVDDYEDYWATHLSAEGYDSVYAKRSGDTNDDGVLTAFRKDMFQLFASKQIFLNDICERILDPNIQARARQDNIALLICLQPWERSALPSALCIANTQLAAGPTLESIRVLQTEFLCREIALFNATFHLPILLAGTFNALPSSDVYHLIHFGRRRPSPQAPKQPERPVIKEITATTVRIYWHKSSDDDSIKEYKIGVKNCTSASIGFLREIFVDAPATDATIPGLSSGVTYQFRLAARNAHGWSYYSQPSTPIETLVSTKISNSTEAKDTAPLYIAKDIPPQVKPYSPSFGSGRTPRFDTKDINTDVCFRALKSDSSSDYNDAAGAKSPSSRYQTLHSRADRDPELIHGERFESAYATYFEYLCEPELTFSTPKFQGTVDYIFYSAHQLAPFQLLALPTVEELEALGDDVRFPLTAKDVTWVKHKPNDWRDTFGAKSNDEMRYMGEWVAPELPNVVERTSSWLPNRLCPSDHLPLACVFAVQKEELAVAWN